MRGSARGSGRGRGGAGPCNWLRLPTPSVSREMKPVIEPLPYLMAKGLSSCTYVLECCEAYRRCSRHGRLKPRHRALGTHRLALPVSKITWNGCGGVPIPIVPTYWLFLKLRSSCGHHSARAQLATVGVPVVPFG